MKEFEERMDNESSNRKIATTSYPDLVLIHDDVGATGHINRPIWILPDNTSFYKLVENVCSVLIAVDLLFSLIKLDLELAHLGLVILHHLPERFFICIVLLYLCLSSTTL